VISPLVAGSSPALGTTMLIWNKPTTPTLFVFSEDFSINKTSQLEVVVFGEKTL
jgi:hypothetical protein